MKKISFAEISIFVVNRIFNWRFKIAQTTKKSKIAKKVINKMLFEKDEIVVIPNTINVNKKIEAEKSEFLPTDVIKDVIKRCDDIVIMNSCLCRTSSDCKDYPQDIGCIFLGPTSRKISENIGHKATVAEDYQNMKDVVRKVAPCESDAQLWEDNIVMKAQGYALSDVARKYRITAELAKEKIKAIDESLCKHYGIKLLMWQLAHDINAIFTLSNIRVSPRVIDSDVHAIFLE